MRNTTREGAALCAALALTLPLAGALTFARGNEVPVNLTEPDQYANRAVSVVRSDNTALPAVLAIAAYEAAAKTFVIETALQGTIRIPASEVRELLFVQSPRQSSPQAQTCPTSVTAAPGAERTLNVQGGSLRIERGTLILDSADVPGPGAGTVLEARRIAYDRRKDLFAVSLQELRYETRVQGCGGNGGDPGASKPLQ